MKNNIVNKWRLQWMLVAAVWLWPLTLLGPAATWAQSTQSKPSAQPTKWGQEFFMGRAQVIDGDTIHVLDKGAYGGKKWKVRIYGVDAPEMDSWAGVASKKQMVALLAKSNFWVACHGRTRDTYGRVVAICYAGRTLIMGDKASINIAMIRAGYGFAYRYFLTLENYRDYLAAEQAAQDARLGLWANNKFVRQYRQKKHF